MADQLEDSALHPAGKGRAVGNSEFPEANFLKKTLRGAVLLLLEMRLGLRERPRLRLRLRARRQRSRCTIRRRWGPRRNSLQLASSSSSSVQQSQQQPTLSPPPPPQQLTRQPPHPQRLTPPVDTVEARLADGIANLFVGGAAVAGGASLGGNATRGSSSGDGGAVEAAGSAASQIAVLQQENDNMIAKMSSLEQAIQQLINQQGGGIGQPAVGQMAPVVGPVAVAGGAPGVVTTPGSQADRQRRAAKADFESGALAWRAGRLVWALRGKRGIDIPSKEMLQTVLAGLVATTDKTLQQLRSMSEFNILDFSPVGNSGDLSLADHFDLTCDAVIRMLKFGLTAGDHADASALARLQPIEWAMLSARALLRMQLLRHQGEFVDHASRHVMSDLPNEDLRQWSNAVMTWVLPMCHLSTAPDSFARFGPPPVPAFAGIHGFASSGSHLIRMFSTRNGGGASVGGRKRRADSHIGGGDVKRKAADKVCFAFRDHGSCKWGADCRFRHVRRNGGSGHEAGGSSVGSGRASGGDGSSSSAAAGRGSSAALVVRGGSN